MPGFLVVKLMHGSECPSHLGTRFLVKSFPQSCLLTIGSITMSSPSLLGARSVSGVSVDEEGALSSGVDTTLEEATSVVVVDSVVFFNSVEEDCSTGAALLPAAFGLKKPARVFWPGVFALEVAAEDFERLTGEIGSGCDRLRDSDGGPPVGGVEAGGSPFPLEVLPVFGIVGVELGLGEFEAFRENISLMLLRLSTSNSGRRRPDAGSISFEEYTS